jgi:Flp pilus assembly pilin Flp
VSDFFNNLVARAYLAVKDDEGQTFTEYALILALIAIACVGLLAALGTGIGNQLSDVTKDL